MRSPLVLAATVLTLLAPTSAQAADVINGDFEMGSLSGWRVHRVTDAGNWFAYKGTDAPVGRQRGAAPVQTPPQGIYAAIMDQANPETLILYQDIALAPGSVHWLSLLAYYDSYEPLAVPTPDTLSIDEQVLDGKRNQQFRIDVMKPEAPIESVDQADILQTVFRTKSGGPLKMPPTRFTNNLTSLAGQTVRLRIAGAVNEEVLNGGVDAVSITETPPGSLPSGASRRIGFGKAKANRRNGTVVLPVKVPAPGFLTAKAKGGTSRAGGKRANKSKRPPKGIKTATVKAAKAGTVKMHLKPTPPALATLRQKGKLRVNVAVTFEPSGGAREVASVAVVLKLDPPPDRRR